MFNGNSGIINTNKCIFRDKIIRSIIKGIKLIGEGSYRQYLEERARVCFSNIINRVFTGVTLFMLSIVAVTYNFTTMVELFITVASCVILVLFATYVVLAVLNRAIDKNKSATYLLFLVAFNGLNVVFFGDQTIYLCSGIAALLMIPILIGIAFFKLRP